MGIKHVLYETMVHLMFRLPEMQANILMQIRKEKKGNSTQAKKIHYSNERKEPSKVKKKNQYNRKNKRMGTYCKLASKKIGICIVAKGKYANANVRKIVKQTKKCILFLN